jgi:hypothetical protein
MASISEQRDNNYTHIEDTIKTIIALKRMYNSDNVKDFVVNFCSTHHLLDSIGVESYNLTDEVNIAIYNRIKLLEEQVKDYLKVDNLKESKDSQVGYSDYYPNSYTDLKF